MRLHVVFIRNSKSTRRTIGEFTANTRSICASSFDFISLFYYSVLFLPQQKKNNEILILNNRIGDLQHELERAEIEARRAENEWNFIQTTAAEKTLQLGNIIL